MAFSTPCSRSTLPLHEAAWCRWLACVALWFLLLCGGAARAQQAIELQNLQTQRVETQIVLSANWQFDLPSALEDALYKGVPLYFVIEADVTRERWYFYDKRLAHAERYLRLAYLPLTQRWRLHVSSQPFTGGNTGVSLMQNFDTLSEALAGIRRLSQWPVMSASDFDPEARQNLALSFRLDLTQLPRPLQIGLAGQSEWNLSWSRTQRLQVDSR